MIDGIFGVQLVGYIIVVFVSYVFINGRFYQMGQ